MCYCAEFDPSRSNGIAVRDPKIWKQWAPSLGMRESGRPPSNTPLPHMGRYAEFDRCWSDVTIIAERSAGKIGPLLFRFSRSLKVRARITAGDAGDFPALVILMYPRQCCW